MKLNDAEIVRIDPRLITFNPDNPNKHDDAKFEELIETIKKHGMAQLPTVRVLPGGIYQTMDGEGRVRAAVALDWKEIKVVSMGVVDDVTAITLMHIANAVRTYDYLAECQGMFLLYKNGMNLGELRVQFQKDKFSSRKVIDQVGIGGFPHDIIAMIQHDIKENNKAGFWSPYLLRELLPMRIVIRHHNQTESKITEYNYDEVRKAVHAILEGKINSVIDLIKYRETRKVKMFENTFNKRVQKEVKDEVEQAEERLRIQLQQQIVGIEKSKQDAIDKQTEVLRNQLEELKTRYTQLSRDAVKRPALIQEREKELFAETSKIREERRKLEDLQRQQQFDIDLITERIQKEQEGLLGKQLEQEREKLQNDFDRAQRDLAAAYEQKNEQLQLKAVVSFQATVARMTELLASSHQLGLMMLGNGFVQGFDLLSQHEILALSAQIAVTTETFAKIQRTLRNIVEREELERSI